MSDELSLAAASRRALLPTAALRSVAHCGAASARESRVACSACCLCCCCTLDRTSACLVCYRPRYHGYMISGLRQPPRCSTVRPRTTRSSPCSIVHHPRRPARQAISSENRSILSRMKNSEDTRLNGETGARRIAASRLTRGCSCILVSACILCAACRRRFSPLHVHGRYAACPLLRCAALSPLSQSQPCLTKSPVRDEIDSTHAVPSPTARIHHTLLCSLRALFLRSIELPSAAAGECCVVAACGSPWRVV